MAPGTYYDTVALPPAMSAPSRFVDFIGENGNFGSRANST
jgi:hypothetical protein